VKEGYENYVPSHLDDPKYVGNYEASKVAILFMSFVFSTVAFFKGQKLVSLTLIALTVIYFKLKAKYEQYFDGFLYWYFGFSRLPKRSMEVARNFGVVPTFIRDFEE
jgi:hypothetical protein